MGGAGFVMGGLIATISGPRTVYLIAGAGALITLAWAATRTRRLDWNLVGIPTAGSPAALK